MSEPLLRVRDMRYRRGAAASIEGFVLQIEALDLAPGGMVGIVGPSGCGKSTLVDLFALMRRPDSAGQFTLMGQDAAAMWARGAIDACTALRARHIGIVLQTGGLLPSLSAFENVMLSQRLLDRIDRGWTQTLFRALDLVGLE
ncbi:MAG: ATP-binding cassette domain-containing protein, partial [Comamonadaceae bacterium]